MVHFRKLTTLSILLLLSLAACIDTPQPLPPIENTAVSPTLAPTAETIAPSTTNSSETDLPAAASDV